jgi:hypothetical protein
MRRRTSTGLVVTSIPHTSASPAVGASKVANMRMMVVLPAPFGPTSP